MRKSFTLLYCILASGLYTHAQTLEFIAGNGPTGQGPTAASQSVNFLRNTDNPSGNTFVAPALPLSVSFALSNQQFTTSAHPGIVFGAVTNTGDTLPGADHLYAEMDDLGNPADSLFTAAAPANSGGINATGAPGTNPNYGIVVFLNANYMEGRPLDSRNYYGDLTLTFSRAVTNPVIQLGGLGAASNQHGHTTEFTLKTPGLSLTRLDGNEFLSVSGADILNTAGTITGAAISTGTTNAGAATGSVQVNGTNITSVTFEVYLRGGGGTGQWHSNTGVSGDKLIVSVSLRDIITLSGNVFYDTDGLNDTLVDNNGGAQAYPFNAAALYANLFSGGNFVAAAPVAADGTYSVSVPSDTNYTVVLSTVQGAPDSATTTNFTPSLPAGWGFTGEGVTSTGDGAPDGSIAAVQVAGANVTNVNFALDPAPESYNEINNIPGAPVAGTDYFLDAVPMEGTEDSTAGSTFWSGKRLAIMSLPTNNFELRYGDTLITAAAIGTEGFIIASYDSSLLSVRPTGSTPQGTSTTGFTYAVIDAAGLKDDSPASYTVNFSSPLPVRLTTFDAVASCPHIVINWATAQEKNVGSMELQVAENGKPFTTFSTYIPRGNNSNYTAIYDGKNGEYLFRLRITERDGSHNFSHVTAASLSCGMPALEIYPVPLYGDILTVKYNAAEKTDIVLYNAAGRKVKEASLVQGRNEIYLDDLSRGIYWLKIANSSERPLKIVKQ